MTFAGSEGDPTPARRKGLAAFDVASGWAHPLLLESPDPVRKPLDARAGREWEGSGWLRGHF